MKKRHLFPLLAFASVPALATAPALQPAPLAPLVATVNIPYETFTLANGLKMIVHTDRKAPVVAVSVWYHVGSKDEPAGETGFAHLYEHLMFYGSENIKGQYFEQMEKIGATDWNGTTWFDRTNYFETVPTPSLAYTLFLESDRMGHLLGAMDQKRLDAQRAVVENEKREDDNQPFGLVSYSQLAALFPDGHPYHHETIGSMADIDGAGLDTVKNWFRQHYGPNNAVLVLAGDIDVAAARPMVERYFGDIPRGPETTPAAADVPTLPAPKAETLHDRVATTRVYRNWAVPGWTAPDFVALDVASDIIGGLGSSRLDNALVRNEKLAVSVSASTQPFERVSLFEISADVKPGVDPAAVSKRLDAIVADFIAKGPSADEVRRAVTSEVASRIRGLESVGGFGGKAVALAEGQLYAGDPGFYKKQLEAYAALTPEQVRAAAAKWLGRPTYALTVLPGDRGAYEESKSQQAEKGAVAATVKAAAAPSAERVAGTDKIVPRTAPPIGEIVNLDFPVVAHAKLANGVPVIYAQRNAVPVTRLALSFDAGNAADPKAALGTQSLMLALLDEGTTTRGSEEIAEDKERLGAEIGASPSMDRTTIALTALSANLAPSLDLLTDIVRNPAFAPSEVERLRVQQLARIDNEKNAPTSIALRTLPPLLYGPTHPYGVPFTGTGDPAAVAKVSRADLIAFKDAWLRSDDLKIFVVSDQPLGQIMPQLERSFGGWKPAAIARGTKNFAATPPAPSARILIVDRPNAPQSLILAGELLSGKGHDELVPLIAANEVLGGSSVSRIVEDLRETKGWAYGAQSLIDRVYDTSPFLVYAPVQTDKTGASIAALQSDLRAFLTTQGVTPAELQRTVGNSIRELPGAYETGSDVLGGMQRNDLYERPDDYYSHLADRYRALTVATLDQTARAAIDPAKLVWVVVGDAAKVKPQLATLGLPIEVAQGAAAPASAK